MPNKKQTINLIELFSGAGGLGIGFLLADHARYQYQPIFAVDTSKDAVESYKQNMLWLHENASNMLPEIPRVYQKSVSKLNAKVVSRAYKMQKGELDLLIGGPPCQGYSPSNRKTSKDKKKDLNNMVKVFMDKVEDFSPKMFLIENVQGVQWTEPTEDMDVVSQQLQLFPNNSNTSDNLTSDNTKPKDVRDYIVSRATDLGYVVWHNILDAANYGIPQHRMRFFFFGVRKDFTKNKPVDLMPFLSQKLVKESISVFDAISDLPNIGNGEKWENGNYVPSSNSYVSFLRRYIPDNSLYDHNTTKHIPKVIERFKQIPAGKNWSAARHLMDNYTNIEKTHSNIYRRLLGNEPAHTISHYRKSMTIHPNQDRGLSFREACRLQSFPDWCRFYGGSDSCQQQLANAVPPLLAATVAWAIAEYWSTIQDTKPEQKESDLFDKVLSIEK